jgi:hypothetical protein
MLTDLADELVGWRDVDDVAAVVITGVTHA